MQILASALPGFRHLRAPLTAGYLWLFFLWILIKPDVHTPPKNEVLAAVYDLAMDAGPIWTGLGIGVAAYLVGSISQGPLSPLLSRLASAVWERMFPSIANQQWWQWLSRDTLSRSIAQYESDLIQQYVEEAQRKLPGGYGQVKQGFFVATPSSQDIQTRATAARRGLELELELPATLLLGKDPDPQLFSEADRMKSEREWRLAVVPPLTAIAILLALNLSPWWWLALIPVVVLLWQGRSRDLEFGTLMRGAVQRGLAHSQSVEAFKTWVEGLPDPSPEQKADEDGPDRARIAGLVAELAGDSGADLW